MNDLEKRFPREVDGECVTVKERIKIFSELDYDEELFMQLFYLYKDRTKESITTGYLEWVARKIVEEDFNSLSKEKRDFITKCQFLILTEDPREYLYYESPGLEEIFRLTTL